MAEYLHLDKGEGVATITIDRPEVRNAVPGGGWDALHDLFDAVARDDEVRVLVLTGAGEDFCSGADVGGDRAERQPHPLDSMRSVGRACQTLHTLPKPTIARVDGVAAGAGLNIDFGGSFILPRIVGMQRAKELVMLADVIDATRAYEMGLINRVVPREDLDALVGEFVEKLLAGPPIALATSKKLLNQSFSSTLEEALEAEGIGQAYQFTTVDTAEAMTAFVEKRPPRFIGR